MLFLPVLIYGLSLIYKITVIEGNSFLYGIVYLSVGSFLIYWYISQYKRYRNRSVIIKDSGIEIINSDNITLINKEDIDCIIVSNHLQILKVFKVTHIFLKNGAYLYFTDDIKNYKSLQNDLSERFARQFKIRKKLIIGFPNITKEFLSDN